MEGLVDYTLVEEVTARLKRIKIDGVLESGYIEEMIEDNPASPFPQLKDTERPDTACSALLEGRVVILIDGTPFVLIAPITFFALFQEAEDYYQRFVIGSAIRWLRYLFLGISLQSEHEQSRAGQTRGSRRLSAVPVWSRFQAAYRKMR
nr:spore germination protein [Brevibacillus agri]